MICAAALVLVIFSNGLNLSTTNTDFVYNIHAWVNVCYEMRTQFISPVFIFVVPAQILTVYLRS